MARLGRLSDPSLVRDRASASFEDTVALVNPAGVDVFTHDFGRDGVPAAYYFGGLCAAVDDEPCMCGDLFCGNTCCVPTDEWDGTYEKIKKWANEGRIPQWVLDKAEAAAGD